MRCLLLLFYGFLFVPMLGAQENNWESTSRSGYEEKTRYDNLKRPLEMMIYLEGVLAEHMTYSYKENMVIIQTMDYSNPAEEQWNDTLYLREDGSLRMVERTASSGKISQGWAVPHEWQSRGDYSEIILYNETGRAEKRTVFSGDTLVLEENYLFNEFGVLISGELWDLPHDERVVTSYLSDGRPTEVLTYRSELLVLQTHYTYDEKGQPVEWIMIGRGSTESWTGSYDNGDKLAEERFYKEGLLARKITYSGNERVEEIYNKGRLSVIIRYQDGEIINEEKVD